MNMTLAEQMARIGRHFGDRTAVRDAKGARTWAEVSERVAVAAGILASLDLVPGVRIAIHSRNSARFDEIKYAAFHAGLVGVPVNWRLAPGEIAHILNDSAVEAVFVEAGFLPAYDAPELAGWKPKLICIDGDAPGGSHSRTCRRARAGCLAGPSCDTHVDRTSCLKCAANGARTALVAGRQRREVQPASR